MLLPQKATILKLEPDNDDSDREGYVVLKANVKVNVQPASLDWMEIATGQISRGWEMYTTQSGLFERMKVIITSPITLSGNTYFIQSLKNWNQPPIPHWRILLKEPND